MKNAPYLSIIIPAYNEEKIIEKSLKRVQKVLSAKKYSSEIIVVDDGSTDKTPSIVSKISGVVLVNLPQNKGKGAALKQGFLAAKGKIAIYSDADLSVDLSYIDDFITGLKQHDIVIASRRVVGADIARHQPFIREILGRGYTLLTQIMMGMDIKDFTCGFKGFTNKAYKDIFSKSMISRWAYDSEIMFLAKKGNYSIKQHPVVWKNREDSRVKLKNVILESFADLVKIRIYEKNGKYD